LVHRAALIVIFGWLAVVAQTAPKSPPRFEDFPSPIDWKGPAAPLNLAARADRSFRTRLLQATKEPPNFGGHYRVTTWGCGSECASGAIVDLATGQVIAPPLGKDTNAVMHFNVCSSAFEGFGVDTRTDSRLLILRCGLNFDVELNRNVPDVYYFLLESQGFRELLHLRGREARLVNSK